MERSLVRAVMSEAVATARCALWPVALLRPLPARDAGRPVVLVHGYLGHREMLRPLARRLLDEGWGPVVRVGYPSTRVGLDEVVTRVGAAVASAASASGVPVDLIGHSLGAVACRVWLRRSGGPGVRRFVSLGGPHAGTSLYRVVPGPLRAALDPRGAVVAANRGGAEPVPTVVVRARYDQQVFPPERASIAGVSEIIVSGTGHNGLLWSSVAHDAVVAALAGAA